jgi:transcription-repair coupling factor (superfamily II helicase)
MSDILDLFKDKEIIKSFTTGKGTYICDSILKKALVLSSSYLIEKKKYLVVCNSLHTASLMYEYLSNLLENETVVTYFSDETIRIEALAESKEMLANRVYALNMALREDKGIFITHTSAFLRYLPNQEQFKNGVKRLVVGQTINKKELEDFLQGNGYKKVNKVCNTLEYSSRGGVLDFFCINYDYPVRIEFFDDEIESIRYFDLEKQTTIKQDDHVLILPASELIIDDVDYAKKVLLDELEKNNGKCEIDLYEKLKESLFEDIEKIETRTYNSSLYKYYSVINRCNSLLDYVNPDVCVLVDKSSIYNNYDLLVKENYEYQVELYEDGKVLPNISLYYELNDILVRSKNLIMLNDFQTKKDEEYFYLTPLINCNGSSKIAARLIQNYIDLKYKICIYLSNENQINNLYMWFDEYEIDKSKVEIVKKDFIEGFALDEEKFVVMTARELFLQKITTGRYFTKFKSSQAISGYEDLQIGDYLVHENYGIGRYKGLETIKTGKINRDYLHIEYKNNEVLYVPLEQFSLVRKYSTRDGKAPMLNKLGSNDWEKTKERIKSKVKDLAVDLIKLYEERTKKIGYSFSKDDELQEMFENDFPYVHTKDQIDAIAKIKKEMEKSIPMDMLLCGDVGFGKTEVAFVAAFKAIKDAKQVALLCPTTLLSSQHFSSAVDRFKNFNIRVELLNRFKTEKEQEKIIKDLKDGKIDMLIGTHRILSSDIKFQDLGLLIVDEEQRFGVEHKEKIKEFKNSVDVLTLSATPIPRTMQMSLIGIRSLCQLQTPPEKRMPIQTYVMEKNPKIIKEIIERELGRNGQVFYLYNKTSNIANVAYQIENSIKGARVGIIHGKMDKEAIEEVTYDFYNNKLNVLVCTTIIETGIDIPNANTIIIENADHFGLSQLYQIKGRVGRSDKMAYAYLLFAPNKQVSEVASNRLRAIKEFTELGSGYKIALRDLSIRGAGDLLGANQSGFIENIGIDLYMDLLKEAIEEEKGIVKEQEKDINNNIQIDGYIPSSYAGVDGNKIELYKKLDAVKTLEQLEELENQIKDIYGKMPSNVVLLIEKKRMDVLASNDKVERIKDDKEFIDIYLAKELSNKDGIGIKLFELANRLDYKNIVLSFRKDNIKIRIKKVSNEWIYYINEILSKI